MISDLQSGLNRIINHPQLLVTLKILLGLILVYLLAYFQVFNTDSSAENTSWQVAESSNSIKVYQKYLEQFPDGKHKNTATENIIKLKQDKLDFENAKDAKTYEALKHYVENCESTACKNRQQADKILKHADKIFKNFKFHLKVKNLSTGSKGYALNDIEALRKILPNDFRINTWPSMVGGEFLKLAEKSKDSGNLEKAKSYVVKAEEILGIAKTRKISESITKDIEKQQIPEVPESSASKTRLEDSEAELAKIETAEPEIDLGEDIQTYLASGEIEKIKDYIANCRNCEHKAKAQDTIKNYEKLLAKFEDNLKNDRLSKGTSNAAKNLNDLKDIFTSTALANNWSQKIADKFYQLAVNTEDEDKTSLYIDKGLEFAIDKTRLNQLRGGELIPESETATSETEKIANHLLSGEIDKIVDYIQNCAQCELKTEAENTLKKYNTLLAEFEDNLKNNRLSKGSSNAAKNLDELNEIFDGSLQAQNWSQRIADKFYVLALESKDPTKTVLYLGKSFKYVTDKKKFKEYREANILDSDDLYKKLQAEKTIAAAENYLKSCDPDSCSNYDAVEKNIELADKIHANFARHLKETALSKGVNGYALDDIDQLEKIFANEPVIKKWRSQVMDKYIDLIDRALKNKQYPKARGYLGTALGIERDNKKVKQQLASLKKSSPQHDIFTKATRLVPAMAYLSGNKFTMGGKHKRSKPARTVKVKPFRISLSEITFDRYRQFARENKTKLNSSNWGLGRRPVINVSWHDAVNYTKWLSKKTGRKFRLPSEAEWEYAASRSPILTSSKFNKSKLCKYANGADRGSRYPWKNNSCNDGYTASTAPVGSFKPNSFGLYDMYGNVWEWTYDCWHYNFKRAPKTATAWIENGDCRYRVIKGGGWNSSAIFMTPKYRTNAKANVRYNYIGFRIVEEL